MNVGTRSLLYGVHAFWWHPLTVLFAWIHRYGIRSLNWRLLVCIFIHDWGYWGASNMDGEEGRRHPEAPAYWAGRHLGTDYSSEILRHSRHYVKRLNNYRVAEYNFDYVPSRLCWADKLSINYDPCWFYLLRARLSGELKEYRYNAHMMKAVRRDRSDREWYGWVRQNSNNLVTGTGPIHPEW